MDCRTSQLQDRTSHGERHHCVQCDRNGGFYGRQLEFRAEGFNPFNHPNDTIRISTNISNPNFLNSDIAWQGHRDIRLWLMYRF